MTYDFRAQQVRLNRIISSGSIPILIYASSSATDLQGGKTFPDPGSDVFLFVSGSSTAKTVFGGDVYVSGSIETANKLKAQNVTASVGVSSLQYFGTNTPDTYFYISSLAGRFVVQSNAVGGVADIHSQGKISFSNAAAFSGTLSSSNTNNRTWNFPDASGDVLLTSRVLAGPNITVNSNSSGYVSITGSGGSDLWTEGSSTFIYTTSSVGIKTSADHAGIDLFISGSDTTGNGANLVLYNDLSGFGLPRLILSSSSGSLGGLIGYDNDVNGLVDGINIDVPSGKNFGVRIGGNTTATTIDSAGNLNVRSGSTSTGYFDVYNSIVGFGTSSPSSYANATKLVLKDTDSSGNKYQVFISNEYPGTDLNSGIAFAFGASNISGAIYAKSNTTGNDRKGLNTLIPTGNSFSWRTAGAHLGEMTDGGNLIISGSVKAYTGFTGSLSGTIGGLPFIVAGPNITASYNSLGQWELSSSGGGGSGGSNYWISDVNNIIYTTGSAYATVLSASIGLNVSGSIVLGTVGTSYAGTNAATGTGAFVLGARSLASGIGSMANGYAVTSSANTSHSEGEGSSANGISSHAEGSGTTTIGRASHSEGWGSTSNGDYSHAEGEGCQAGTSVLDGQASHAEGYYTIATGNHSHAEGYNTKAIGTASHTGGSYTIASGSYQTVYGKYNKRNNITSLFVVGDGTGDSDALRHDILRVESGSVEVTGSFIATGITGSISGTVGGLPFILAGPNITASYNSYGQWTITGSGGGSAVPGGSDTQIQFNSGSTFSGSSNLTYNYNTNTFSLTGSLTASTIVAGGVNITPITASLVIGGDGINRASGSISGLFESGSLMTPGTIGKFDIEILAMDFNSETGASWKYTATALWPYSGNFNFIAATELAAEYGPVAGSYNPSVDWDVNFNGLGQIELTGSSPAFPSGGTSFYIQVTKKMIAAYGAILA